MTKQGFERGVGPYAGVGDGKVTPAKPDSDKSRDISGKVERNQTDSGNTVLK